jgi:hypothetical protein
LSLFSCLPVPFARKGAEPCLGKAGAKKSNRNRILLLVSCLSLLFSCLSALACLSADSVLATCLPAAGRVLFISPHISHRLFKKNSCDKYEKGVTNLSKKNSGPSFHSISIEKKMVF